MPIDHENPEALANAVRNLAIELSEASSEMVLVGGQSVLFWAEIYGVPTPPGIAALTEDVDFVATSTNAMDVENVIANKYKTSLKIATMDDVSPNSAKMSILISGAGKINIDFLRQITGLDTDEVVEDAAIITIDGHQIKVIPPLLLMKSKISNLGAHLNKRCEEGVGQARMSVDILHRHLVSWFASNPDSKPPYQQFEQIIRFSRSDAALYAFKYYGIDPLAALPVEAMAQDDPFVVKRLPVAREQIGICRAKFDALIERMESINKEPARARFQP